jgi:hypothetical protein
MTLHIFENGGKRINDIYDGRYVSCAVSCAVSYAVSCVSCRVLSKRADTGM